MNTEEFITHIKRGDTPLYAALRKTAKKVRGFEVPKIPGVHSSLFWLHMANLRVGRAVSCAMYYQPLFRSRCASCGEGLCIIHSGQGIPWLVGKVKIDIGDNVVLHDKTTIIGLTVGDAPTLTIGDDTQISQPVSFFIGNRVTIGSQCLVGCQLIADNPGHRLDYKERISMPVDKKDIGVVTMGDYVWAALGSMVVGNVTIGTGAVLAARAVVTRDVPPFCVVAGAPARVVKKLEFPPEMIPVLGEEERQKHRDAKVVR